MEADAQRRRNSDDGHAELESFFFEEKRILRRKRTGTPDHTRDSHSATKRERDVDTAKLKAGGALTGGRLGPLQGRVAIAKND